jgi:hypothetical protein
VTFFNIARLEVTTDVGAGLDVPFAAGAIVWTTMVAVPVMLVASVIV